MLRDYLCCCGSTDPDDDRHPVLLVSGIAGSILNSKKKKSGFETRVWVRIMLADLEFKKKLWSIYNPQTGSSIFLFLFCWKGFPLSCSFVGYTEPLDDTTDIVVPQDDYGLYAIDILDPSFVSLFLLYNLNWFLRDRWKFMLLSSDNCSAARYNKSELNFIVLAAYLIWQCFKLCLILLFLHAMPVCKASASHRFVPISWYDWHACWMWV